MVRTSSAHDKQAVLVADFLFQGMFADYRKRGDTEPQKKSHQAKCKQVFNNQDHKKMLEPSHIVDAEEVPRQ